MDVEPQQQQMVMVEGDQTALLNIASMTDFGVEGLGDQHINGSNVTSHNQAFHLDKSFVCEICGKAFRFRSNLAEHRSVHTAVKPFVCKFCGKSSRLKGNLTSTF
uniref:C2H2-type domain-containing protein n=1 Tax=Ditylenchus dipsaci TaxID=166011 RepID=A0A915EUK8_9BILA